MKKIIIHEEAEKELWHAVEFYEDKVNGLGLDLEKEVEKALISIRENPQRYAEVQDGVRRCLLRRFPFFIYFTEHEEVLWIVAMAHTSRKPFYWRKRLSNK